jgi:hypothetical protein
MAGKYDREFKLEAIRPSEAAGSNAAEVERRWGSAREAFRTGSGSCSRKGMVHFRVKGSSGDGRRRSGSCSGSASSCAGSGTSQKEHWPSSLGTGSGA